MEPRMPRIPRIRKLRILRIRAIRVICGCCFLGALARLVANSYDVSRISGGYEFEGTRTDLALLFRSGFSRFYFLSRLPVLYQH